MRQSIHFKKFIVYLFADGQELLTFFKLNICIFLEILDFSVFVFSKLGLFIKRLRESN